MSTVYVVIAIWIIGIFLLRVVSKCGVESYLKDNFSVFKYDEALLPCISIFWPLAIIVVTIACAIYFGAIALMTAFEFVVDRAVALVCPNGRKP